MTKDIARVLCTSLYDIVLCIKFILNVVYRNILFFIYYAKIFTQKDFLITGCAVFNAVNIWRRRINLYAFRINEYFNDKERIALGKGIIKYLIYCALYAWPTFRAILSCTARNNQKTFLLPNSTVKSTTQLSSYKKG